VHVSNRFCVDYIIIMISSVVDTNDYINQQIIVNEYNIIEMKLELYYVCTQNKPSVFRTAKNKVESVRIMV